MGVYRGYSSAQSTQSPDLPADKVAYDNLTSGLSATNVQTAVDALKVDVADVQADLTAHTHALTTLTGFPTSYAGQGGKALAVNSGATAVEFVNFPSPSITSLMLHSPSQGTVISNIPNAHSVTTLNGGLATVSPNNAVLVPFRPPYDCSVDRIQFRSGAAPSANVSIKIVVYEATAAGAPSGIVITGQELTLLTTDASGYYTLWTSATPYAFKANKLYWICANTSAASSPNVYVVSQGLAHPAAMLDAQSQTHPALYFAHSYANAFPATPTGLTAYTPGGVPIYLLRVV